MPDDLLGDRCREMVLGGHPPHLAFQPFRVGGAGLRPLFLLPGADDRGLAFPFARPRKDHRRQPPEQPHASWPAFMSRPIWRAARMSLVADVAATAVSARLRSAVSASFSSAISAFLSVTTERGKIAPMMNSTQNTPHTPVPVRRVTRALSGTGAALPRHRISSPPGEKLAMCQPGKLTQIVAYGPDLEILTTRPCRCGGAIIRTSVPTFTSHPRVRSNTCSARNPGQW